MTKEEEDALFEIRLRHFIEEDERRKRERVSPKLEQARNFKGTIIGAQGGRSAGAKTTGIVSLNVQRSHREEIRVVGLREIQASIEESLYQSVEEAVDYLKYPGWRFPRSKGYCESPIGSKWVFRGLKDLRAASSTKGLQGFDVFIMDEAQNISGESIDMVLPTVVKVEGSQLWFAYNPETESDPIFTKVWRPFMNDSRAMLLTMLPEGADNPWWNEGSQMMSDKMKKEDPDLWEHIYGGKPRKQGQRSVLSRASIREAMERQVAAGAPKELGVDVARFGDDKSTFGLREGMKGSKFREESGKDTQEIARIAWDMVGRDHRVPIKVDDTGVGCITERTKVLTPDGWKVATDLRIGDEIYSRDDSGQVVVESIRNVSTWDDTVILQRDGYEFSFSHIVPYRSRIEYPERETSWENILKLGSPYLSTKFEYISDHVDFDLPGHSIEMPHGGRKIIRKPMRIDGKDFCSFLGWFLSEGHIDGGTVAITQKKSKNFDEIRRVMGIFGSTVTEKKGSFTISNVTLAQWLRDFAYKDGTGFRNIKVPRFVANNSRENIDAFLGAFMAGDGYLHHGRRVYMTSGRWMVDDLIELVTKAGRYCGTGIKHKAGSVGVIEGRQLTRTVDCWIVYEFSPTQDNGTRRVMSGQVEVTSGRVVELSITGPSKLFLTMCPNNIPVWTHNGGVTDKLKDLGANVIPVNFGGVPKDKEKYTSVADEMWFEFGEIMDQVQLPDDPMLMEELSGRQFKYTNRDQRKIEPKEDFKKRIGRSPDRADCWLLAFYRPNAGAIEMSEETRKRLEARARR